MLLLSELQKECDYFKLSPSLYSDVDRLVIAGRRGTGKSTGVKMAIAEGLHVLVIARTKRLSSTVYRRYVPPAVSSVLPEISEVDDSIEDMPQWRFGEGAVRAVPVRAIPDIRETGVDVYGRQADLIINDEALRTDGAYVPKEPDLLDDLAATVGRSGKLPKIIIIGNPKDNKNPYSYTWRADVCTEGIYTRQGMTTRVVGTADCRDCFNRKIGIDAGASTWAPHIDRGGAVYTVNGEGVRLMWYKGWLYCGTADPSDKVLMVDGRYTGEATRARGMKYLLMLRDAEDSGKVVYDSFAAQMILYTLLRLR